MMREHKLMLRSSAPLQRHRIRKGRGDLACKSVGREALSVLVAGQWTDNVAAFEGIDRRDDTRHGLLLEQNARWLRSAKGSHNIRCPAAAKGDERRPARLSFCQRDTEVLAPRKNKRACGRNSLSILLARQV